MLLGFNVNRSDEAAVLACSQVRSSADVGVIEAKTRRPRHKGDSAAAVRRDERCTLFGRSIDVGRNELSVPVQLLGRIRLITNIDGDSLTFFKAKQQIGRASCRERV